MAERISVVVVDLKSSKRDVSIKEIVMSPGSQDEESVFLLKIQKLMRDGLSLYTSDANKLSYRRHRPKRELRRLRNQYPPLQEMHDIVATLDGDKNDKSVVVYRSEGKFVGFKIEERKSQPSEAA